MISTGLIMMIAGGIGALTSTLLLILLPGHFRKKRRRLLERMDAE